MLLMDRLWPAKHGPIAGRIQLLIAKTLRMSLFGDLTCSVPIIVGLDKAANLDEKWWTEVCYTPSGTYTFNH